MIQTDKSNFISRPEKVKQYIRPFRRVYIHNIVSCNKQSVMYPFIAETFARNPKYHGIVWCDECKGYYNNNEFKWLDGTIVGS